MKLSIGCIVMEHIGDGGDCRDGLIIAAKSHGVTVEEAREEFRKEMMCTPEEAQAAQESLDGGF